MKPGDVVTNSIWIIGDEPESLRVKYKKDVVDSIDSLCKEKGFFHGEIVFTKKYPGHDDVPCVPDHIQGQAVCLLVAEATIIKKRPETSKNVFVDNLDKKDLKKLRKITKVNYASNYGRFLNDSQCDEIIEELGPDVAIETMRRLH